MCVCALVAGSVGHGSISRMMMMRLEKKTCTGRGRISNRAGATLQNGWYSSGATTCMMMMMCAVALGLLGAAVAHPSSTASVRQGGSVAIPSTFRDVTSTSQATSSARRDLLGESVISRRKLAGDGESLHQPNEICDPSPTPTPGISAK